MKQIQPKPGAIVGRYSAAILMAGLVVGCGDKEQRNRALPPPIESPTENYLEVLENVREKRKTAEDLEVITQATEQFQLRVGRTPANLHELVHMHILDEIPTAPEGMEYHFDPVSGNTRLKRAGINYLNLPNGNSP